MSSVKSVTVHKERPWRDGFVKRMYEVTLTDNNSVDHVVITGAFKDLPLNDGSGAGITALLTMQDKELSTEDKAPLWNADQATYYRRALGKAMLLGDVDDFYAYLPLFLAMETNGGANANQRALYLGTDRATYDLIAKRFGDVQGIAFFLDNAKGQVWDTPVAGF